MYPSLAETPVEQGNTPLEQRTSVTFSELDMDIIAEALRLAVLTIGDAVSTLERMSPGGHGAERLRMMAEDMVSLQHRIG